MRIKNFRRFVNENLNPHSAEDETIYVKSRQGEPTFFDKDEFSDEEWAPTGDKPRKLEPEDEPNKIDKVDDSDKDDDKKKPYDKDDEPFISDTDDETEESDKDYLYL